MEGATRYVQSCTGEVWSYPPCICERRLEHRCTAAPDCLLRCVGIGPSFSLLEDDKDENGDLLPPKMKTLDVNLTGVLYTVKLAVHYIKQNPEGGSIVMTGSGSSKLENLSVLSAKMALLTGAQASVASHLQTTVSKRIRKLLRYPNILQQHRSMQC